MADISSVIEDLEKERCEALISADIGKLEGLFSDRLNWCHSSGRVDTKAQLLERISSGATRYLSMKRSDTRVIVGDSGAVATGLVDMVAIVGDKEHTLSNRYTTAWLVEAGRWRLVAWQSTKAPEN